MTLNLDDFMEVLPQARRFDHYVSGICPFHEDRKPSLLVFDDGWFRCLGCSRSGNHEYLWSQLKTHAPSFAPAERTRWKAPRLPKRKEAVDDLIWQAHQTLLDIPSRGWYLQNRGLEGRIIPCKLGWFDGWVTVPIFDSGDEPLGVVLRAGPHIQKVSGERFIQPQGQKPLLYVPDWKLLGDSKGLIVVYGLFDALTLAELRVPSCTTTGGKGVFPSEWLDFYRGRITIVPDAGEDEDARELASKLGWRGRVLMIDYPNKCKDANDMLMRGHRKALLGALAPYIS